MADKTNFILRWEIDNAKATFETEETTSRQFNEGGFKWFAGVKQNFDGDFAMADFSLRCEVENNENCDAQMTGAPYKSPKVMFNFDVNNSIWLHKSPLSWGSLESPEMFNINDKVIIEFHVNVIPKSEIVDPGIFAAPNDMSNVILKIGEERLHVSKEFLAVHSPVFKTLFFGEFAEKNKEEIEIKDVVYENNYLYSDRNVPYILMLADRFHINDLLKESEKHLTHSNGIGEAKKLLLSDQYRLTSLKNHCLNSFSSVGGLASKIKSTPEYDHFSADMKVAICDRIMELYTP